LSLSRKKEPRQPGTAALFVAVRKVTADKVLEGLKGEGGTVLKTSLDHSCAVPHPNTRLAANRHNSTDPDVIAVTVILIRPPTAVENTELP